MTELLPQERLYISSYYSVLKILYNEVNKQDNENIGVD